MQTKPFCTCIAVVPDANLIATQHPFFEPEPVASFGAHRAPNLLEPCCGVNRRQVAKHTRLDLYTRDDAEQLPSSAQVGYWKRSQSL